MNLVDLYHNKPEPPSTVFPGLLAGSVGSIIGQGSAGKSFLALQLGLSVASPDPFDPLFDQRNQLKSDESGPVKVLMAEDPEGIIGTRLHYMLQKVVGATSEANLDAINEKFHAQSLVGSIPRILDPDDEDRAKKWRHNLLKTAEDTRFLIIDPLSRFHGVDENDNVAMTKLVQVFESITEETDCTILFTHHSNQGARANASTAGKRGAASRGATALTDAVRWQMNLRFLTEDEAEELEIPPDERTDYVGINLPKSNYRKSDSPIWCRRKQGGVISACSLDPQIRDAGRPERSNNGKGAERDVFN
jgi:RecA-family ATPase